MPKEFTPSSSADSKPPSPNTPDNSPIPVKEDEGSGFQDSRLVFRQDSIAVKSTRKAFLFHALFMALGPLLICFGLFNGDSIEWLALVVGIGFTIPMVLYLYTSFKSRAPFFDVVDGTFYPNGFTRDGSGISLKQFDHLEILWKRVKFRHTHPAVARKKIFSGRSFIGLEDTKYSYNNSYELNVVLKDGSRYNIMDHGNDKLLLDDAKRLADRLSLPLINANTAETIAREQTYIPSSKEPLTIGAAIIIFVIFGLMFFCVGSVLTYFISIRPLCGWFSSANWTPTPARVVSCQLSHAQSRGHNLYGIDIQYVYNINGTSYTGSRYGFYSDTPANVSIKKTREIVSSMPEGKEITCLVNPANLDEAVISRKIEFFRFLLTLIPLPFPFIGIIVMIYIIRTLRRQKAQSQLAPHPAPQ